MRLAAIACALIVVSILSGCAYAEGKPDVGTAAPSPTAQPADFGILDSLASECVDMEGDSGLGGDIVRVELTESQGLLFITFRLAGGVNATDFESVNVQILSYGLDGNGGYVIGTTFVGGHEIAAYVFDNTTASQINLSNGVIFADGAVSMRVPLSDVTGLVDGFTWRTTLTVNDVDVDVCDEVTVT